MHIGINVTTGPAKGEMFTFYKPDCFLFGRAADARVSLADDPYVSRQHFLLEISPPECKVTDLGSKNGLFVNGIRYGGRRPPDQGVTLAPSGTKEAWLKDGDEISVGDTTMKISIEMDSFCLECGAKLDETDNDGNTDQTATGRLCNACQERKTDDPMDLLRSLLKDVAVPGDSDIPVFKGYRIEGELGRGGMSVVYRATEERTGQRVAIKTMRPQIATDEDNIRIFQREIKITGQLRHKNIVEIFKYGKSKSIFYFVLELVDGMDLDAFVRSRGGRLDIEEAAPIMMDILDGLAYAHKVRIKVRMPGGREKRLAGIVHRDLKPQNILLMQDEQGWIPKIVDFGLSKSFESAGLSNMTIAGQVAGTPIYWPREQITHYKYLNPATDVFSIAAVFYEMLTGCYVREGFDEMLIQCQEKNRAPGIADFMRIISGNPPLPIRSRRGDIPKAVADVIDRALREAEVPPDENKMRSALARLRYPDAGIFQKELANAYREAGIKI